MDMEFDLSKCLAASHSVVSDEMLSLYTTDSGLLYAVWKVCWLALSCSWCCRWFCVV